MIVSNPGVWGCVKLPHSACGMIEQGVSVQQNGGMERLGNYRSATKTQRKLAPWRKVGMWAVSCWGAGRIADLQAKEYILTAIYFCCLTRPFQLVVTVLVPVCLTPPAMLAFAACGGSSFMWKAGLSLVLSYCISRVMQRALETRD